MTWYIDIFGQEQHIWQSRQDMENWFIQNQFEQHAVCSFYHANMRLSIIIAFTTNPDTYHLDENNLPKFVNIISMVCWQYGVLEKDYWQWAINFAQAFNWKIQDNRLAEAVDTLGIISEEQKTSFEVN